MVHDLLPRPARIPSVGVHRTCLHRLAGDLGGYGVAEQDSDYGVAVWKKRNREE